MRNAYSDNIKSIAMRSPIQAHEVLTPDQQREVKAALALAGLTYERYTEQEGLSFGRFRRMLSRIDRVSKPYADKLNRLVNKHLYTRIRQAA